MAINYKVIYKKPLIWPLLQWRFPKISWESRAGYNTITTIGNRIYTARPLAPHILKHELIHVRQQHGSSIYAYLYFIPRYFVDKKFRDRVEAEGHVAEGLN